MTAHGSAIESLLAGVRVHLDPPQGPESLPDTAFPYVVVYLPPGVLGSERLSAAPHRFDIDFRTVCVATSKPQLDHLWTWVVNALAGRRPAVPDRVCSQIEHLSSLPPGSDPDVPERRLLLGSDSWAFNSTAA